MWKDSQTFANSLCQYKSNNWSSRCSRCVLSINPVAWSKPFCLCSCRSPGCHGAGFCHSMAGRAAKLEWPCKWLEKQNYFALWFVCAKCEDTHWARACAKGRPRLISGCLQGESCTLGCRICMPPPSHLPNTEQLIVPKVPLHKHKSSSSSSKAGAGSAMENKSLNILYIKFKLYAKAEINLC